jgi:hypothetical protein
MVRSEREGKKLEEIASEDSAGQQATQIGTEVASSDDIGRSEG